MKNITVFEDIPGKGLLLKIWNRKNDLLSEEPATSISAQVVLIRVCLRIRPEHAQNSEYAQKQWQYLLSVGNSARERNVPSPPNSHKGTPAFPELDQWVSDWYKVRLISD